MLDLENDLQLLDDDALMTRVRQGEVECFGILYARYFDCAARSARRAGTPADHVEDIVAEGFARTLRAINGGRGPTTNFAGYLSTTTTRVAWQASKERSQSRPTDDFEFLDSLLSGSHDLESAVSPALDALEELPEAWRTLLWRIEIEDERVRDLAVEMGKSSGAVSAMATRARHCLRRHPDLDSQRHRLTSCA